MDRQSRELVASQVHRVRFNTHITAGCARNTTRTIKASTLIFFRIFKNSLSLLGSTLFSTSSSSPSFARVSFFSKFLSDWSLQMLQSHFNGANRRYSYKIPLVLCSYAAIWGLLSRTPLFVTPTAWILQAINSNGFERYKSQLLSLFLWFIFLIIVNPNYDNWFLLLFSFACNENLIND